MKFMMLACCTTLLAMLEELKKLKLVTDLKLNFDKTKVLRLGSIHGSSVKKTQENH